MLLEERGQMKEYFYSSFYTFLYCFMILQQSFLSFLLIKRKQKCSQRGSVSSGEEFATFYSIISCSPLSMKKFSHKGSFEDLP